MTFWKQIDAFPIIINCLIEIADSEKWTAHDEIENHIFKLEYEEQLQNICSTALTREIVSNMVAWLSQKYTEYESGDLSENYYALKIVENVYLHFERKEEGTLYSYRKTPYLKKPINQKETKRNRTVKKRGHERTPKQIAFAKFVQNLKNKGIRGSEYRKAVMEWKYEESLANS